MGDGESALDVGEFFLKLHHLLSILLSAPPTYFVQFPE
jgi:hypothetical protein